MQAESCRFESYQLHQTKGKTLTKIFYRFEKNNSGWRYKYKNYVSKPYKTREEARNALDMRVAKLKG